jgi:hypothetical protein
MKRDMEELKKDVESVKALTGQQGFQETNGDTNQLRQTEADDDS